MGNYEGIEEEDQKKENKEQEQKIEPKKRKKKGDHIGKECFLVQNTDEKIKNFISSAKINYKPIDNIYEEVKSYDPKEHNLFKLFSSFTYQKDKITEITLSSDWANSNCFSDSKEDLVKEVASKFRYFSICWFDPNKSEDSKLLEPAFRNVKINTSFEIEPILEYLAQYSGVEDLVIISPGRRGEELTQKIHNYNFVKAILIYCMHPEYHEGWAKKYEKIKGVIKTPSELYKKLLEINSIYVFPKFNYGNININDCTTFSTDVNKLTPDKFSYNTSLKEEWREKSRNCAINSLKRETEELEKDIKFDGNKYNIFCMKMMHFFKNEKEKNQNSNMDLLQRLIFISLYFSDYPYLYNTIEDTDDILTILKQKIENLKNDFASINSDIVSLSEAIQANNPGLLIDNRKKILNLHKFLLSSLGNSMLNFQKEENNYDNYYQIKNFCRDFDFVLKLFLQYTFFGWKDRKYFMEIKSSLEVSDRRFLLFDKYFFMQATKFKNDINCLTKEQLNKLDKTLAINKYIVFGDSNFYGKISKIKKDIKIINDNPLEFKFVQKYDELGNYLFEKIKKPLNKSFRYFIIINEKNAEENFTFINYLACEFGAILFLIILVENKNSMISKKPLKYGCNIPIIITYDVGEIVDYFSPTSFTQGGIPDADYLNKKNEDLCQLLKLEPPKYVKEKKNENWNIIDEKDLNEDLIRSVINKKRGESLNVIDNLVANLYKIYQENKCEETFLNKYGQYYGISIYPEILTYDLSFIKQYIYAYTKEEKPREASLYMLLNSDLRSGEPKRIYRHLLVAAMIEKLITKKELVSFFGTVFRGEYLTSELINAIKKKDKQKMINTTFWSTTKNKTIAETRFLKNKNTLIIIDIGKEAAINIDLEIEQLSQFPDEQEVLMIPFTTFEIEQFKEKGYNGKNLLKLKLIKGENKINEKKMKLMNLNNNLDFQKFLFDSK